MQAVSIYVPSMDAQGKRIINSQRQTALRYVQSELSRLFGGCTVTAGYGAWVNGHNDIIREPVNIVQSFTDEQTAQQNWEDVRNIAQYVKDSLQQESVLISLAPVQAVEFI